MTDFELQEEARRFQKEIDARAAWADLARRTQELEHWQRFRDEAAMRFMTNSVQPMISDDGRVGRTVVNSIDCREWADRLVAELRANPWKMPE